MNERFAGHAAIRNELRRLEDVSEMGGDTREFENKISSDIAVDCGDFVEREREKLCGGLAFIQIHSVAREENAVFQVVRVR